MAVLPSTESEPTSDATDRYALPSAAEPQPSATVRVKESLTTGCGVSSAYAGEASGAAARTVVVAAMALTMNRRRELRPFDRRVGVWLLSWDRLMARKNMHPLLERTVDGTGNATSTEESGLRRGYSEAGRARGTMRGFSFASRPHFTAIPAIDRHDAKCL